MDGERGVSCNVLVIPEDPTYNGYILKPLVSKLLEFCGKGNANVEVLTEPKLSGFEHACRSMPDIVNRYQYKHLLLFLPDRDGKERGPLFANLEAEYGPKLICCAAVEEVEAWLLAGHIDKLNRPWPTVRADISVKENVFAPFLRQHGDSHRSGGGREELMRATLTNLSGLLARCPELDDLRARICEALA